MKIINRKTIIKIISTVVKASYRRCHLEKMIKIKEWKAWNGKSPGFRRTQKNTATAVKRSTEVHLEKHQITF